MTVPFRINHTALYVLGLGLMIVSLPLSQFALSVGQFVIVGNWLLERNFKKKIASFFSNKPAMALVSLYLLHVAGLLYTHDMDYAIKDLRIKLPLLALPILFSTTPPLDQKKFEGLIWLFISATVTASLIGFGILMFTEISDIREISPFVSHIRLSLNICLAIFFSGYFLFEKYKRKSKFQILLGLIMAWLLAYLIISESATGFYVMLGTSFLLIIMVFTKLNNISMKLALMGITALIIFLVGYYLYVVSRNYLNADKNVLANLEYFTSSGNTYSHDTTPHTVENGNYIGLYVCDTELRTGWNARSKLDYDGHDLQGHELKTTLIRYLNSKGLRKDSLGLEHLSDTDIRHIELGIANVNYSRKFSLNSRIYKVLWEYQTVKNGGNPGGLSLIQRTEFWKTGWGIIKENFWTGVGTGDMDDAFKAQYDKMGSNLAPEYRLRSHNQFMAFFTAFGVFGFLWFVFTLTYPPLKLKAFRNFRYTVFFIVILLSMLVEDTLETQMGVTLYAFFNAFMLFVYPDENKMSISGKVVNSPSRN